MKRALATASKLDRGRQVTRTVAGAHGSLGDHGSIGGVGTRRMS